VPVQVLSPAPSTLVRHRIIPSILSAGAGVVTCTINISEALNYSIYFKKLFASVGTVYHNLGFAGKGRGNCWLGFDRVHTQS